MSLLYILEKNVPCVYVCVHMCMCVYMGVHMCVCAHACIPRHLCMLSEGVRDRNRTSTASFQRRKFFLGILLQFMIQEKEPSVQTQMFLVGYFLRRILKETCYPILKNLEKNFEQECKISMSFQVLIQSSSSLPHLPHSAGLASLLKQVNSSFTSKLP